MYRSVSVSDLLGKTLVNIDGNIGDDEVTFKTSEGSQYKLYHEQDCCENVSLEDIVGDFEDLLNSPLLMAEEIESDRDDKLSGSDDSYSWTFYKFATIKGYVTLRWYGSSNGYYSEGVNFAKVN